MADYELVIRARRAVTPDGIRPATVAIRDGKYDHAPLPDPALGPRKVDVATQYNAERFRPQYADRLGDPMLLSAHLGAPVVAG